MSLSLAAMIALMSIVISATTSVFIARAAARGAARSTQFTVRAQVKTTYRTKWLDSFRDLAAELLFLGQQVHTPLDGDEPSTEERRHLRKVVLKLIVLLGREKDELGNPKDRLQLAELARAYAAAPSPGAEPAIEALIQIVFEERWGQIKQETGELDDIRLSARAKEVSMRVVAKAITGDQQGRHS